MKEAGPETQLGQGEVDIGSTGSGGVDRTRDTGRAAGVDIGASEWGSNGRVVNWWARTLGAGLQTQETGSGVDIGACECGGDGREMIEMR